MKRDQAALLLLSSALTLSVLVAADRVAGRVLEERDLIFRRFSVARYETPEFTFESRINNLGFRDREFRRERTRRFRIAAIGDSYTYGWGVAVEDSWPKILERELAARGYDVEVANLGRPGGSASDYAKIAAKAVPALKPDLVIVGLLQGDDLAQVLYSSAGPVDRLKEVVKTLFPNFLEMAHRPPPPEGVEVRGVWKAEAARLLAHYTPEQRTGFDRIDPEIRSLFAVGQINPALVDLAVSHPDYLLRPLDLEAPEVQDAIASLAGDLRRIRRVSERFGARMVVISVPLGAYTSRRKLDSHRRTGFLVADWLLTTTAMDAAAADAAHRAGVDFHEFTRAFREVADTGRLFFELDGHFTPAGSRVFAHGAEPIVAAELDRIAEDSN